MYEGSRKRRRSPPPLGGYGDEYKVLAFKHVTLDVPVPPEKAKPEEQVEEKAENAEEAMKSEAVEESTTAEATEDEPAATATEEKMDADEAPSQDAKTEEPVTNGDSEANAEESAGADATASNDAPSTDATEEGKEDTKSDAKPESKSESKPRSQSPEKKRPVKPSTADFFFNRQHMPSVVCRLSHEGRDQVKILAVPSAASGVFIRCLLDESQKLMQRASELQKELRLDDKFDCDSFHLEFVTGRRQASRPSHHHVTLPVHAYYLLRLYYFKEVRSQSSLSSDVRAHVPAENWARYYEGRRRFLDDQSTRARHYNREDDDLVARYVRNYERAKDSQKRRREEKVAAEAKAKREAEEAEAKAKKEAAEAEAKAEADAKAAEEAEKAAESGATEEETAEKTADGAESETAAEDKSQDGETEKATETSEEPAADAEETSTCSDKPAAAESSSEATEETEAAAMDTSTTAAAEPEESVEEELEALEILYVEGENFKVAKTNYPLGEIVTSVVNGLHLDVAFDPEGQGIPSCTITVRDFPAMRDATAEQIAEMLVALEKWCDQLNFNSVCTLLMYPTNNQVRIIVDIASFLHRIDTIWIPKWAKAWRECKDSRLSTSLRAIGDSSDMLDTSEPAAIRLAEWSEY